MKGNKEEYLDCGMLIKLISEHIQSHANKMLIEINVTASQLRYLEYLSRSNDLVSFKEVEKHFQASQPTVSGIMHRLAEKNLIVVEAADFGRAKKARLTEKGRRLINEPGVECEIEEKLILSALQEEERKTFHDMLERVNQRLSE